MYSTYVLLYVIVFVLILFYVFVYVYVIAYANMYVHNEQDKWLLYMFLTIKLT